MIVAFEGIDGSGKTTISKAIYDYLKSILYDDVFLFSEPSQSELGKRIKTILTNTTLDLNSFEESLLFTVDRSFLIRNNIIPLSKNDKIIIMDRTFVSTYTYQIFNITDERLRKIITEITEFSVKDLVIDIMFYLKCKSDVAMRRISHPDRIESKGLEFMSKVSKNYDLFFSERNEHIKKVVLIDTSEKTFEEVFEEIKGIIISEVNLWA